MHLQSQTDTVWDENGLNPLTTTRNYYYDNIQHLQLNRTETTNSKSQLVKETLTYPPEHAGTAVYDAMISRDMLSPMVTSTTAISGSPDIPVAKTQLEYAPTVTGSNDYAPTEIKKSVKGNALETEGKIDLYDNLGNILQFTGKDEVTAAVIWGYNYKYPVARVVGATYAQAVALLSVSIATLQTMDGTALITELHRIRTGLPAASVTSYTYKPGTGVTSITDPNNKINTYEYDALSRLLLVKDQDGNAVKKNEYNLAGTSPGSPLVIYLSHQVVNNVTCTSCLNGYNGNTLQYVVPYGKYYSLKSQALADAQADADNGGVEYSKINGICTRACN
jgi:YD repeat-containing protein